MENSKLNSMGTFIMLALPVCMAMFCCSSRKTDERAIRECISQAITFPDTLSYDLYLADEFEISKYESKGLVEDGLLEFTEQTSPERFRSRRMTLTEKGRQFLKGSSDVGHPAQKEVFVAIRELDSVLSVDKIDDVKLRVKFRVKHSQINPFSKLYKSDFNEKKTTEALVLRTENGCSLVSQKTR